MKLSIALLSILLAAGVASANNKEKADALFKKGKQLMGEKRYADACASFEQSNKLDPGIGTMLNLGKCYEEWGKIGRAYLTYQDAVKMAKDAKDDREPKIQALVDGLDPQVPRLTIKLPKDVDMNGLKITLDNQPLDKFGEPRIVDPGPHMIEWAYTGGKKRNKVVPVDRGGDSEVTLEIVKDAPSGGGGDEQPVPVDEGPAPGRNMRIGGLVLGGAGVIAIGVSSIMTLSARGQYNDALEMHCGGSKTMCNQMGLELTHDARSTANTATIIFLVGTAAVGGGVALYLLAPKSNSKEVVEENEPPEPPQTGSLYLVPSITPNGAGLVLGGTL